jgi:plastocyanin
MKRAWILIAVVALAGFGLVACGDDDDDDTAAATTTTETAAGGGGGGGSTVAISSPADGLAYDQTDVTATAGSVTIDYTNPQGLSHDVVIEDSSGAVLGKTDLVTQGDASTTVDLQPGTYTFFCDVSGHRDGGMEGTLTVN